MKNQTLKSIFLICILHFAFLISSNAQIVYTDIPDITLNTSGSSYQLDLNNDGINDFSITVSMGSSPCSKFNNGIITRFVRITTLNQSKVARDINAYPSAILQGVLINNANYIFKDSSNQLLRSYHQYTLYSNVFGQVHCNGMSATYAGNWNVSSEKYLGLKILKNGMNYFGWVRLSIAVSSSGASVTIRDYAYNSQNNQSVVASEGANYAMVQLLPGTTICAGGSLAIPYTIQGSFNAGNVFTAQLSNSAGSFSSPVTIGSVTSTVGGTLITVIPSSTPYGSAYKIRIISSNPVQISSPDNGVTLVIHTAQSPTITTNVNPACGSSSLQVSIGGSTFQWRLNGANIQNAINSSYSATVTGNYSCFVTNSCGSVVSNSINQVINALPAAAITPTGTVESCPGSTVTLSASTGNGLTYQWYKETNTLPFKIAISGATNSTYNANSTNAYQVKISNASCYVFSSWADLYFRIPPASISNNGPLTFCTGDSTVLSTSNSASFLYQWKKNNVNINGATSYKYTAFTSGKYKVKVTNPNGNCDSVSKVKTVTVNCRIADENISETLEQLSVYPNPSLQSTTISFSLLQSQKVSLKIFDMNGRLVSTLADKIFEEGEHQIVFNAEKINAGIYFLQFQSAEIIKTEKLMVTK